jgi:hypothetical protein
MAMIKCPECGRDVSSNAAACPGCGSPVGMKSGPFGGHEKGVTVRPGFWHDRNVGAVGFLILFIVLLIISGVLLRIYGGFTK